MTMDTTVDHFRSGGTVPQIDTTDKVWRLFGVWAGASRIRIANEQTAEVEDTTPKHKDHSIDWDEVLKKCDDRRSVIALLRVTGFDAISNRLTRLLAMEADLAENEPPLRLHSLKGFADFLRKEHRLERPAQISVGPDGNITAEWHYTSNRHLAIKFLDEKKAKFASISPARNRDVRSMSINGTAPWAEVVDALRPINVTRWSHG